MLRISTILHPTDFSDSSAHALALACSLAREHGARLIVLHVVPTTLAQEKKGFGEEIGTELEQLAIPDKALQVERRLLEGDPATRILEVAKETGCDLIALGTHGRSGLSRLLMGSVAEQVVRLARCPVLTLKSS
jgi:universal stress protein A